MKSHLKCRVQNKIKYIIDRQCICTCVWWGISTLGSQVMTIQLLIFHGIYRIPPECTMVHTHRYIYIYIYIWFHWFILSRVKEIWGKYMGIYIYNRECWMRSIYFNTQVVFPFHGWNLIWLKLNFCIMLYDNILMFSIVIFISAHWVVVLIHPL